MTPMKARTLLAAAAALGLAGPAFAATPAKSPDSTQNCFQARDWQDWRAPNDKTILVRVNQHDVWRLDLSGGSNMLTDQTNHLITNFQQSDWICHAIDLNNMKVSDGHVTEPLFVKSITKLTPEQVAAIPEKDRP
jgi:hypothetical protein